MEWLIKFVCFFLKTPKRSKRRQLFQKNTFVKKILRSIKRRSKYRQNTPRNRSFRHGSKQISKRTPRTSPHLPAKRKLELVENIEIETCLITSDDDDCMLIEPMVESITIGDDEPSTSHFAMAMASSTPVIAKSGSRKGMPKKKNNYPNGTYFKDSYGEAVLKYKKSNKSSPRYSISADRLSCPPKSDLKPGHDVIILDETTAIPDVETESVNDSFKCVEDKTANGFIPLVSKHVPNPTSAVLDEIPAKPATAAYSLFSASEKKALRQYNTNTYNPAGGLSDSDRTKKRHVVIDGSNVAYGHALSKKFSVEGLKICIEYFVKMGHDVKAVVPLYRKNPYKSSNPQLLEQLNQNGNIVFTPCKNLPGLVAISYDDRFVLQLACELDAAIISNDNYRDLIVESAAFKKLIENRVIGYTWCNDIFILPKDPYGRGGPTLDSILNR